MRCRFELDVVKRGGGLRTDRMTGGLLLAQFGEADTKIGWKSSSRLPLRSTQNEETPLEFLKVSMCQLWGFSVARSARGYWLLLELLCCYARCCRLEGLYPSEPALLLSKPCGKLSQKYLSS